MSNILSNSYVKHSAVLHTTCSSESPKANKTNLKYQNTDEEKSHSHETKVHAILYFKHARKANLLPSHLEASSCIQITRKTASHYSSMHSILSQQA